MIRLASLLFAAFLLALPARAEEPAPPEALTPEAIQALSLDELLDKLPQRAGSRAGKALEAEVLERFHESGSDTADLLLSWAVKAMEDKDYPEALDILDQLIVLKPDFAEGWNKRATVHYLADDYASSVADIRQTLALQPRHFGALSGLGMILQETGQKEQAIVVLRKALAINPQLDKIKEAVERLEKETAGDAI
jgi:tetratricopeptide (TPR) repeat protein